MANNIAPAYSSGPATFVLTCRDTDPVRRVEIHTSDASSGEPLARGMAWLTAVGCATSQTGIGGSGRAIFEKVPMDAALSWWAMAEGYVPRFGDESALVASEGLGTIEVALHPGWGARVEVLEAATGAPLAGVGVLLDGVSAGTTDAAGRLDLEAQAAPAHVDLDLQGWRFVAGDYDSQARSLSGFGPTYSLRFEREG